MSPVILSALANHLWQSTLFVAVVGLLALLLRRNQAQVRHWLWLAASAKFLVPFAGLVALGGQFGWQSTASVVQPDITLAFGAVSQPFSRPEVAAMSGATASAGVAVLPVLLLGIWGCGCAMHLLAWWVRWRRIAVIVREASPLQDCRELDALRRVEQIVGIPQRLAVVTSDTSLEPGVFGILKSVLVWPRSIGERLDNRQLEAILAHELCHVRRRDNLAAAVHMAVEAIFWFHPLVWWIEKQLIEERERACDEEVIRLGSEPQVYAEGILRTCEFYAESPLVCVSGATGSDLTQRVEAIMRGHGGQQLNIWKKLLLATFGVIAVALPIGTGVLNAPPLIAQSSVEKAADRVERQRASQQQSPAASRLAFDAASIKPNKSGSARLGITPQAGGRFTATNMSLGLLIRSAYQVPRFRMSGGPDWIESDRFDVVATAGYDAPQAELRLMLQTLLAERFTLKTHTETREQPVYELVIARRDGRLGPNLRRTDVDCDGVDWPNPVTLAPRCGFIGPDVPLSSGRSRFALRGTSMEAFARFLPAAANRYVVNRTGLDGHFDGEFDFTVEMGPPPPPPGQPDPYDRANFQTIFTVLQEQLGLKLESTRGPVEVLVIDSVEQPTPD